MIIEVGVLAIQGGFLEHIASLYKCARLPEFLDSEIQIKCVELRSPSDISDDIDGIILPGGESTTAGRLLSKDGFGEKLIECINGGKKKPTFVWGTCSGLIVLANQIENQQLGGQFHLGGLDVTVSRNYFGRQFNSFESSIKLVGDTFGEKKTCDGVFIRAPAVTSVNSNDVQTLALIEKDNKDIVVGVQQNNKMATAFHPELTEDLLWHKYFIRMILNSKKLSV